MAVVTREPIEKSVATMIAMMRREEISLEAIHIIGRLDGYQVVITLEEVPGGVSMQWHGARRARIG